jgi:energy-coupling factor transport system permease protein
MAADRGSSWLHRVNPVVKLAWATAVVIVAFATYHPVPLFAIAAVGFLVGVSAGVGRRIAGILLIFAPVTASILVIQTLGPAGCQDCEPVARIGPLALYGEGMLRGLSLVGRLLAVETVSLAVILTTHATEVSAALARLRVPHLPNLLLTMTLQLIPVLQREFEIVLDAQRSRGMPSTGFRAVIPSFVPVFAGAFERVQRLTIGLESRAFGSSVRRTSYRRVGFGPEDIAALVAAVVVAVLGAIAGLTIWGAAQMPDVALPAAVVVAVFVVAGTLFVAVIAAGIRSLARV